MKFFALMLLIVNSICGCAHSDSSNEAQTTADGKAEYAKEDAADFAAGKEAKVWLSDQNHVFFKVSKETVAKLTADLYAAGAAEVRVGKLDMERDLGNKEFGGNLVVKFPTDAGKRKSTFDAMNKFWKEAGDDPVADTGQAYASFSLD